MSTLKLFSRHVKAKAFTLIELLLVLGLLLLLGSIATLSYQIVIEAGQDSATENSLNRAVLAQRAYVHTSGTWGTAEQLPARAGLVFTSQASTDSSEVSVGVGDNQLVGLAALSDTGTCFAFVLDDPLASGRQHTVEMSPALTCSGASALAVFNP